MACTIEKCPECGRDTFHERKSYLMEAECLECKARELEDAYIYDADIEAKAMVHGEDLWKGY